MSDIDGKIKVFFFAVDFFGLGFVFTKFSFLLFGGIKLVGIFCEDFVEVLSRSLGKFAPNFLIMALTDKTANAQNRYIEIKINTPEKKSIIFSSIKHLQKRKSANKSEKAH